MSTNPSPSQVPPPPPPTKDPPPQQQQQFLQSPSKQQQRQSKLNRRSLRERLRDGINLNSAPNPFQQSNKSKSIDSSTPASNLYNQTTNAAMDFLHSPFEMLSKLTTSSSSNELYTVQVNDTITSIAANYESTPSELIKLNKLSSRLVFPGQILKIPLKRERREPRGESETSEEERRREAFHQRKFIKLNVRHVTDGNGVISGTLLVTPNAVMFDPNVSDPLVIDQGAEVFGVILPFELIAAAAIYNDISTMKVRGVTRSDDESGSFSCVIYPPSDSVKLGDMNPVFEESCTIPQQSQAATANPQPPPHSPTHRLRASTSSFSSSPPKSSSSPPGNNIKSKVLKRLSFPLTWSLGQARGNEEEGDASHGGLEGAVKSRYRSLVSFEDVPDLRASFEKLLPPTTITTSTTTTSTTAPPPGTEIIEQKPHFSSTTSYGSCTTTSDENWFLCLTMGLNPSEKPKLGHMISYGQKHSCKPEYWFGINSIQDVDELYRFWMLWWPHLYGPVDEQLIASRGIQLIDWETNIFDPDAPTPAPTTPNLLSTDQFNDLTKESWEMIKAPYTKLYSFIRTQTDLLSSTSSSTDLEWGSALDFLDCGGVDDGQQSKVVSMTEELHRLLNTSSEYDHYVPELLSPSEILESTDVELIAKHLIARAQGYPWSLVFSTTKHGFSLSTLYRRMEEIENSSPILVVIEDTKLNVFGALLSTPLRVSDHFYGTGQSFLFILRTTPTGDAIEETPPPAQQFQLFKWTGENNYFIKGNLESVSIGAGDGHFGLWLDSDLFVGRSEHCSTYNNIPLVAEKDFVVKTLEAWCFGSALDK